MADPLGFTREPSEHVAVRHRACAEAMVFSFDTQCKDMSKNNSTLNQVLTLGGRIQCNQCQCQAKSKRSGVQCLGPAVKGKKVCRMHGGISTGAKTTEGRILCTLAKTTDGQETSVARVERSIGSAKLAVLESVGHALGLITGQRTRGRKPKKMDCAYAELQETASLSVVLGQL